ncbi:MAG: ATPase [Bacteroidota bacterium]
MSSKPQTFLCISCYFKGSDFLKSCKAAGNTVYLLTVKSLEHADWPRDSVDEFFYMESDENSAENYQQLTLGMAHVMRERSIDRIVALDDFDVEKAAYLREEFRIPGMGQTTARYFRDKLAMRMKAEEEGIPVPAFTGLFNNEAIHAYCQRVPAPWILKPRAEASTTGMKKIYSEEELWSAIDGLGEERHRYLLESFKPGDVYHADALTVDGEVVFCRVSKYLATPFEVAHGGGIFRSMILPYGSEEDQALQVLNTQVLSGFGMQFSASHTEFIRCHEDGKYYFLETSSRVGGAHLAEMVEAGSGINLWGEWAKIETAKALGTPYSLPTPRNDYAGILVSLSRFQHPDQGPFQAPEVVWRLQKDYHVGMIVQGSDRDQLRKLLDEYAQIVHEHYHASAPVGDKSSN